jgi:hypothetical protein
MVRLADGTQALAQERLTVRQPTAAQRARRSSLCLTRREEDILAALTLHRYLTVAHLERAVFPPSGPARRSHCVHAYQRVRLLWLWGYLHRVELPRRADHAGSSPALWALAPAGARYLADLRRPDLPPAYSSRPGRVSPLFLSHNLQAAWCWASLQALVHAGRVRRLRWLSEPVLRARHTSVTHPTTGRRLSVLPDAYFELTYADGRVQCAMLEIDMDTETDDDFTEKLIALERYRTGGHFQRDFGHEAFETLVLTCTEKRRTDLWALGRKTVPAGSWRWYSFATFEALAPGRLDDALWRNLAGEGTGLLYD